MTDTEKLDKLLEAFHTMNGQISFMNDRLDAVDNRLDSMDRRFDCMDKQFDSMDKRFDSMDKQFDSMDKRFDSMDKRFEKVDQRLDVIEYKENRTSKKLDDLQLDVKISERDIKKDIHVLRDEMNTVIELMRIHKIMQI